MFHTGKRNGFAVLLYNTKYRTPKERGEAIKEKEDENQDDEDDQVDYYANQRKTTVHELVSVTKPGIATVRDISNARETIDALQNDYVAIEGEESPEYCPLQLALDQGIKHMEQSTFVKSKSTPSSPKTDRIQVWVWTNDPKPHRGEDLRAQVNDLKEEGRFNLVVWGMPGPDEDDSCFDYGRFFDSLAAFQTPLRDKSSEEMQDLTETIMPELKTYWKPTRPIYRRLPLLLPDWQEAKIDRRNSYLLDWYRLVSKAVHLYHAAKSGKCLTVSFA